MKKWFFNIYFWLVFVFVTLVGLTILPIILCVNVLFLSRTLASGMRRAIRFYGWVLVCLVPFLAPVRVEYRAEKIPPAVIFTANHNSAIDPYLFGAIIRENSFVTSWPFKIPLYGLFMRLAGYADVNEGWDEVCRKCKKLLAVGSSVTIWPEGHRSRNGRLGRFKNGAFALAVETDCPIVPVCILGSATVLAPGETFFTPARVKLLVLAPVYPQKDLETKEMQIKQLKTTVYSVMEKTLADNGHFRQVAGKGRNCTDKKLWI